MASGPRLRIVDHSTYLADLATGSSLLTTAGLLITLPCHRRASPPLVIVGKSPNHPSTMTAPSLVPVATHVHHISTFFTAHHRRSPPPHVSHPLAAPQATFFSSLFQNRATQLTATPVPLLLPNANATRYPLIALPIVAGFNLPPMAITSFRSPTANPPDATASPLPLSLLPVVHCWCHLTPSTALPVNHRSPSTLWSSTSQVNRWSNPPCWLPFIFSKLPLHGSSRHHSGHPSHTRHPLNQMPPPLLARETTMLSITCCATSAATILKINTTIPCLFSSPS